MSSSEHDDYRQRYQEVMAAGWDPLLIVHCGSHQIVDANPAACRLYGMNRSEIIGSSFSARFSEQRFMADIFRTHRDYVPLRFQRGPAGRHFPVEMSLRYFTASDGECAAIAVRDISDRMSRERADNESERKYQSLFEASPYPILMLTTQGMIVDANRCALLFYGYEHDELAGRDWSSLEAGVGPVSFLARPTVLPATRHLRKNGSNFMAEVVLSYFRLHAQSMVLALVRDVTEHWETFAQLQESEARWRFGIEGHGDALIDWPVQRQSGSRFYVSPMLSRMLGYDEAEDTHLDADAWDERVHPDDRQLLIAAIQLHMQDQSPIVQAEYRMRTASGEYRWVALRARFISMGESATGRLIGAVRDIHESRQHKQQELANQEKMFRLERLATVGEMLSALAHEVNQPLTAITNYSSLGIRQLSKPGNNEEVRTSLSVINSQALRAGEIVRRIRDFVRRGEPNYVPADLNQLVQQVVLWAKSQAEAAGIAIQMDFDSRLPLVDLDVLQIEQVVFNLLRNGIEAMRDEKQSRPRTIILKTLRLDDMVEVSVRDHGEGMQMKSAEDAFDPFVSTKPDGMGMGLAISRTIVESHRGRLWAEAVPGERGTRFAFTLNLLRPARRQLQEDADECLG
jgi:two-component system, LuxR family, sensor kinase FixL